MITFSGGFVCQGKRVDCGFDRTDPRNHHRTPSQDSLWQEAGSELNPSSHRRYFLF